MLISDVINGWGNNAEGLAINGQLDAKEKEMYYLNLFGVVVQLDGKISLLLSTRSLRLILWWQKLHTQPPGIFLERTFTSS
jgi:hypothetical protein